MTSILRRQVETYRDQVCSLPEADWMRAHQEAMACRDLDELIDLGMDLFDLMKSSVCGRKESARDGQNPLTIAAAREAQRTYQSLEEAFAKLDRCLMLIKSLGYEPKGQEQFQAARGELRDILSLSIDRVAQSVMQLEAGQARPLKEVMDELRAGSNARGR